MFILACFISFMFIPAVAEAWGPLTHVYLANQVLNLGIAAVPVGIYSLIKRFKGDFLYGNLSADIILGRRFQGFEKNSHSWDIAWKLFRSARTEQQKAFAYGYLTHLCADTVAHNLNHSTLPFTHPILEIKSDSIVDKRYRKILTRLDKPMQKKNDIFLEKTLDSVFFSFKTNRRIFKGFLAISKVPNYTPVSNFLDKRLPYEMPVQNIFEFQQESLNRMLELLQNGKKSDVLKKNPSFVSRRRSLKRTRAINNPV
jgi:hypothetical protein